MNIDELKDIFGSCELVGEKIVIKQDLLKFIDFIKNNYKLDLLKSITAIDNGNGETELLYNLFSTENEEEILVAIKVLNEAESISLLFDSAVADEKEIYDLFGINFIGNNELKRLYMPENWKGHPLKKDYEEKDERLSWND